MSPFTQASSKGIEAAVNDLDESSQRKTEKVHIFSLVTGSPQTLALVVDAKEGLNFQCRLKRDLISWTVF